MSAEFATSESEIRNFFAAGMKEAYPAVAVHYANERATVPAPAVVTDTASEISMSWVRLTTEWYASDQADIHATNPRIRTTGAVIVQVFTPTGRGSGVAEGIANEVIGIFRRAELAGMTFRAPFPNLVGSDPHGWYQINVIAPMKLDAFAN